jgi:creatinine amidohydrolase
MSVGDETFHALVADLVRSLAAGGFRRIVLVPTHGGNFGPLAAALEKLGDVDGVRVDALTDLSVLFQIAILGQDEHGVPLNEGGLHAGEWETSLMLALHPDLVKMDRAEAGFTGDPQEAVGTLFRDEGVAALAANGVLGDPARASAEHGRRYWDRAVELALESLGDRP